MNDVCSLLEPYSPTNNSMDKILNSSTEALVSCPPLAGGRGWKKHTLNVEAILCSKITGLKIFKPGIHQA